MFNYCYPFKAFRRNRRRAIRGGPGQFFPADRRYAIENGPSGFDPSQPAWLPKSFYLMLMRNERLAGLRTHYEDESHVLTIRKAGSVVAEGDLETAEGRAAVEAFLKADFAGELKGPPKILSGGGHSFSDVARKVVSIINLGSVSAVENMVGLPVHPLRFRANLYVSGWPAWHELELVGQTLAVGDARLKVVKRITRCAAVNVDPETAAAPAHHGDGADLWTGDALAIARERACHVRSGAVITLALQDHVHEARAPETSAARGVTADIAARFGNQARRTVSA